VVRHDKGDRGDPWTPIQTIYRWTDAKEMAARAKRRREETERMAALTIENLAAAEAEARKLTDAVASL